MFITKLITGAWVGGLLNHSVVPTLRKFDPFRTLSLYLFIYLRSVIMLFSDLMFLDRITIEVVIYKRVRKIGEKRLLALSCLSVRPSARREQLGSH